jgi:hypothetical protein
MARYKGQLKPKTIEREFLHIVKMLVPDGGLGRKSEEMNAWHRERGLAAKHGLGSGSIADPGKPFVRQIYELTAEMT